MRLDHREGERIDRDHPVFFTFERNPVKGFRGDTIGSALYASGLPGALAQLQVPPAARPALLHREAARTA